MTDQLEKKNETHPYPGLLFMVEVLHGDFIRNTLVCVTMYS